MKQKHWNKDRALQIFHFTDDYNNLGRLDTNTTKQNSVDKLNWDHIFEAGFKEDQLTDMYDLVPTKELAIESMSCPLTPKSHNLISPRELTSMFEGFTSVGKEDVQKKLCLIICLGDGCKVNIYVFIHLWHVTLYVNIFFNKNNTTMLLWIRQRR